MIIHVYRQRWDLMRDDMRDGEMICEQLDLELSDEDILAIGRKYKELEHEKFMDEVRKYKELNTCGLGGKENG